jgi:hypothetical protein
VPNANGVVYPRDELEKAVEEFNKCENIVELGDYNTTALTPINLEKAAAMATAEMEGDYVVVNLSVMDTPCGRELKKLVEDEHQLYVMPTAIAEYDGETISDMKLSKITVCPYTVSVGDADSSLFEAYDK